MQRRMELAKKPSESSVDNHTYKVFPNDLNSHGTAFGGMIMAVSDRIALVAAERHSRKTCVTASIDSVHFLKPAKRGDILLFSASVNRAWRTSMEIGIKVVSENRESGEKKHILSAYFTFVAVDDEGKPTQVPAVVPETSEEKQRFEEAEFRRSQRKATAEELKRRRLLEE